MNVTRLGLVGDVAKVALRVRIIEIDRWRDGVTIKGHEARKGLDRGRPG